MKHNKTSILIKSRELFERFGYQKTTLTDIAKSVGKVKTAIYYYFSGKEEIFAQLVQVESEEFYEQLKKEVEQYNTSIEQLENYVLSRIHLMQDVSKRYAFLKREFFELMPLVEENRKVYYQKEVELIKSILSKGVERNEFTVSSIDFSATMLVNSLKGLEVQMYVTDQMLVENINLLEFSNFILYGVVQPNQNRIK